MFIVYDSYKCILRTRCVVRVFVLVVCTVRYRGGAWPPISPCAMSRAEAVGEKSAGRPSCVLVLRRARHTRLHPLVYQSMRAAAVSTPGGTSRARYSFRSIRAPRYRRATAVPARITPFRGPRPDGIQPRGRRQQSPPLCVRFRFFIYFFYFSHVFFLRRYIFLRSFFYFTLLLLPPLLGVRL